MGTTPPQHWKMLLRPEGILRNPAGYGKASPGGGRGLASVTLFLYITQTFPHTTGCKAQHTVDPSTSGDPCRQDKPLTTTTFLSFLYTVVAPPLFWGPPSFGLPHLPHSFHLLLEGITLQVYSGGLLPSFSPTFPPSLHCLNWLCGC